MIVRLPLAAPGQKRDHGGGIDAAIQRFGGHRADWIDLSTGINPVAYPLPELTQNDWTALPDEAALTRLLDAARAFWNVPDTAEVLATPGASAPIALMPLLGNGGRVQIVSPTYNEHAAAFLAQGWTVVDDGPAEARVLVHPNNPDGRLWSAADINAPLTVIDESFCDVCPERSLIAQAGQPGNIVLKSFGKFWGLAGVRLGFAIGTPKMIARLRDLIGPWAVSGPALRIGAAALEDADWAISTRIRLTKDREELDDVLQAAGAQTVGGTALFGLYDVDDAQAWRDRFAAQQIWTRVFPYSPTLLRLGLPPAAGWSRLKQAL